MQLVLLGNVVGKAWVSGQLALSGALTEHHSAMHAALQVARLMILNTPLALGAKLRPELAAYKNPVVCVSVWCCRRAKGYRLSEVQYLH